MPTLHIQHTVVDYDSWKQTFDSDPVDRKGAGVRRFTIHRSVADPSLVMIDLDFDTVAEAEKLLDGLRRLWNGPGAALMRNPEAWILETVQTTSM